jgi:hypothetical protein
MAARTVSLPVTTGGPGGSAGYGGSRTGGAFGGPGARGTRAGGADTVGVTKVVTVEVLDRVQLVETVVETNNNNNNNEMADLNTIDNNNNSANNLNPVTYVSS